MHILVDGTTVKAWGEEPLSGDGVPFEVDDFPGTQDGKALHWDGLSWWYENDTASPAEVLTAMFAASPDTMQELSDATLSRMAAYMQPWEVGKAYGIGDLREYGGLPYRCLQAHTSAQEWAPDIAVSLWARVLAGGDDVPVWEQPDSTNPYMKGDRVHFPDADGPIYVSIQDYNVFAPNVAGWQLEGGE